MNMEIAIKLIYIWLIFNLLFVVPITTTFCDNIDYCQWLAKDQWFSPVSSTNKTDHNDIPEIFVESGVKHQNPNPICIYICTRVIMAQKGQTNLFTFYLYLT